jgi:hypothetical protein
LDDVAEHPRAPASASKVMVAAFAEVIESEETLVAGACNVTNLLVIPF